MKVDDVPQDKGFLIEGKISDLNYAVDENGRYTSRQSRGWKPKNEALSMAWDVIRERAEKTRQLIIDGTLSPIAFYMELNLMDAGILSGYTGISKWRTRGHLKMKNFRKLNASIVEKYAEVFNITPAELTDMNHIREVQIKYEN